MLRCPIPFRRGGAGWRPAALAAWVALAVPLARAGVPYTEPDILRAFEEVALKGAAAPEKAQWLAFKYHHRLDELRLENRISDRIFQANQANFTRLNDAHLEQAAKANHLVFGKQAPMPGKTATPMSDTDAIMGSPDPKASLKAAQIHNANADYQRSLQQMMAKHGLSAPDAPPPDTNTSIMPDPRHMTREQWQEWAKAAVQRGEVVYRNPIAAAAEAKMRAGEVLNAYEATARVGELQRLAAEHFQTAEHLEAASRQASAVANHAQARQLQLQAQVLRQNAAKYVVRIHETGQYLSGKAGLTPTGQAPSSALKQAAVRGHAGAAPAKQVAQQAQELLDQANRSFMDNLSHVATQSKDPALVAQAKRQMAQALNHLPAEQRAEALAAIGKKGGAPLAREVERTMRMLPRGKPATVVKPEPSRLDTAVKVLGTAMVIYQGVTRMGAVREAKYFAEQFTGLPEDQRNEILEQLTPEQRDYLDEAIARIDDPVYQEQMRRAGFIPQWHTAAQSDEAGRQLGGFTGGYVGGKIGVLAGIKLGAMTGTAIGGPVGTVVGAGVGLVVGVAGYMVGSYVGTSMGDTRSSWWDHNQPDEEFNRRALAAGGMEPKAIYDRLVARGVDPETALEVAKTYRDGSLDAFTAQIRAVREVIGEIERRETERRQREDDNRRRAEDHRIAREFFEDAWARTERQEREQDRRVEQSYQEWTEHLAGLPPKERERSMADAGLTPDQRKELEERVAALPPGTRVATPAPAPIPAAPSASAARRVLYGQTVDVDLGEGFREGVSGPVDANDPNLARWQLRGSLATPVEQEAFDEGYRHGFDAASLRDYWKTAPPPEPGSDAYTMERYEERHQRNLAAQANDQARRAYLMGYRLSLDGVVDGESGVRFVFQSTPTLAFDPPESADGRTRVVFERMGTVHVWAQVETTADGQTRRDETPRHAFEVAAPELVLDIRPPAVAVGQEIRARIQARPAVADSLLNVVWSSPPSSQRHHHGASGVEIAVTPAAPGPVAFRAEVRAPVHGDLVGTVSGTCEVSPAEEAEESAAPGADAEKRQQLINEGYALEQRDEWAAAIGKYREAQAIEADSRVQARIDDLQARIDARDKAQQLIHEGYALEQRNQLPGAIGQYEAAVRLVENPGIRQRIEQLRLRLDQQDRAQALVNEGYALERRNDLPGAIGKYEAAVRLVDNPGIRAKIADLRAEIARQEDQVRRDEAARRDQQRQEQARLEQQRVERERLERERLEREKAERQRAERDRAERDRLERQRRDQEDALRRDAEARRKAEEDARRRQQEEAQRSRFTGTFEARVTEGGTTVVMRLVLRQSGNRVSGTFSGGGWSENFSGSIRGDRLYPDEGEGESFALGADGQTLRGPGVVFRRVR